MAEEKKVTEEVNEEIVTEEVEANETETEAPVKEKKSVLKTFVTVGKVAEAVAAVFGCVVGIFMIKDTISSKKRIAAAPQALPSSTSNLQSMINETSVLEDSEV